jgi:hypothetical protein
MHPEQAIAAVRFDPLLPPWLIALIAVPALLLCGYTIWRGAKGGGARALAFLALAAWLCGPRLVRETRQTTHDVALLVVDKTASMTIGDRAAIAEAARAGLVDQARRLPDLDLRTVEVTEKGDGGTQLFGAVERALADIPRARLAGIVAISDGQIHDLPATPPAGVPFHLLVPAAGEETDRRLRLLEAPGFGVVGKPVTLRFVVEDLGAKQAVEDLGARQSAPAMLTMRRDGEAPRTTPIPVGREQSIEVPIDHAGPTVVELSVSGLPGEVSPLNNTAVVEIHGVRDRLRVLLVSGEPHPGERTWRRLLKADPSVDLVHFTILRPPEKDDQTPLKELSLIAFPVRELFQDKIGEFDLIILDRFQNRGLLPMPYLANIAARVRDGGALLMSVGPEYAGVTSLSDTPLRDVLPSVPSGRGAVVNEAFRPVVSDLGQRHPVTSGLPGTNAPSSPNAAPTWGHWYRHVRTNEAAGDVLMRAPDGDPLLVLNRVGEGRVALLLSDQIWLWSRGHDGGGPQAELLRRVAHWLMREPALEENALTARVRDGRLMVRRRSTVSGPPGDVRVTDPEGHEQTLPLSVSRLALPGEAEVVVDAPLPGVWRVTDGARTAFAAVGAANPLEISDLRATAQVAGDLARKSGGGVHFLGTRAALDLPEIRRTEADRDASGGHWIGLWRRHDDIVTGVASMALLPSWVSVPLLLMLLAFAWWREAR